MMQSSLLRFLTRQKTVERKREPGEDVDGPPEKKKVKTSSPEVRPSTSKKLNQFKRSKGEARYEKSSSPGESYFLSQQDMTSTIAGQSQSSPRMDIESACGIKPNLKHHLEMCGSKAKVTDMSSNTTHSQKSTSSTSEGSSTLQVPHPQGSDGCSAQDVLVATKKYTPLEQQFIDIKAEYPDAVLFVECGYKYRFFGEDAEIASKELKIGCFLVHNFVTASIPVHRLHVHLRRLVAMGYKVGVVKQVETAALKAVSEKKSGPFTRKLTALYTRTTLIGADVHSEDIPLDSQHSTGITEETESLFLLCVCEKISTMKRAIKQEQTTVGFIAIQPSTGRILYEEFTDQIPSFSELQRRLCHIRPAEIIYPSQCSKPFHNFITEWRKYSGGRGDVRLEQLPEDMLEYVKAFSLVTEFCGQEEDGTSSISNRGTSYGVAKSLHLTANLPSTAICCLGALIHYLKPFNLQNILRLGSNFEVFKPDAHCLRLNRVTLESLEIFTNQTYKTEKGSLFWVINHTRTPFGRRELINWLSFPLRDIKQIEQRQKAVLELSGIDCASVSLLKQALCQLPDLEKMLCSAYHKKCSHSEFYYLAKSLMRVHRELLSFSEMALADFKSELLQDVFIRVPLLVESVKLFLDALCERAARYGDYVNLFVKTEQFPDVYKQKQAIAAVEQKLFTYRKELRKFLCDKKLDYVTVSGMEYLIEVKNKDMNRIPSDWTRVNSTKTVTRFHPPPVSEALKLLSQHREHLRISSKVAWDDFLNDFNLHYMEYNRAISLLATTDCLLSLSKVAQMPGYICPQVVEGRVINITGGKHPVVDLLLGDGERFVPNDTNMNTPGLGTMIITGPNMGGKSCYIKQVAVICIMAQIGSFIPAESARIGVLDAIYTRMGASDKLFAGKSTFMMEMLETVDIMRYASDRSLVILDELGRGTSTHDGTALAYATLVHFIEEVKCLTLFVTHYPLITCLERKYPQTVANYHLSYVELEDSRIYKTVVFLYHLEKGRAGGSYGLNVAALAGLSDDIIAIARVKSEQAQKVWSHDQFNFESCLGDFREFFKF